MPDLGWSPPPFVPPTSAAFFLSGDPTGFFAAIFTSRPVSPPVPPFSQGRPGYMGESLLMTKFFWLPPFPVGHYVLVLCCSLGDRSCEMVSPSPTLSPSSACPHPQTRRIDIGAPPYFFAKSFSANTDSPAMCLILPDRAFPSFFIFYLPFRPIRRMH